MVERSTAIRDRTNPESPPVSVKVEHTCGMVRTTVQGVHVTPYHSDSALAVTG
jgi:hypothetical protein